MVRPCVARELSSSWRMCGLASMYPAFDWSFWCSWPSWIFFWRQRGPTRYLRTNVTARVFLLETGWARRRLAIGDALMFFVLSKLLGVFAFPSNVTILIGILGLSADAPCTYGTVAHIREP